jgi:rhodanese-related sulfurtransferase
LLNGPVGKPNSNLDVAELSEKLKNGKHPLVLDVPQPDEYRMGYMAGAKLIPLGDLTRKMQTPPKHREIVYVCASGNGSSSATQTLVSAGYNAFNNMQGGMSSWHGSGFATMKGDVAG